MDTFKDKSGDEIVAGSAVIAHMTPKSGKMVFSRKFRREAVGEDMVRFESLFRALAALPILPNLAATLDNDLIRRSIFGTAAIEGNPLSEREVGELLAESRAEAAARGPNAPDAISPPPEGARKRAEREILNLGRAYERYVTPRPQSPGQPLLVSEELIREMNRVITAGLETEHHAPGQYRNTRVEVGDGAHGGKYVPPKALVDIQQLMPAFVDWINSEAVLREGHLVRAALAHYHLGLIHPFGDGNGRTARLLEAALLIQGGYRYIPVIMSNHYYRTIDDYYVAFRQAEKSPDHDITPFLAFFTDMLTASVQDVQESIHDYIRVFALRDFYHFSLKARDITRRQFDLLHLLLPTMDRPFSLKALRSEPLFRPLYREVSEKTARRDLERMEGLGLIKRLPGEDRSYRLNLFALD